MSKYRTLGLLVVVSSFCCTRPALSIVLHPDGEPNLVTWTDRPDPNVIGRWGSNASCVAVSSNCVITVRHAGGGTGTPVEIGGKTHTIAQIWNHTTADLRLIKLNGANLANFVDIYENTGEIGKEIVIGGFGDGRAALLQTSGITYGYQWDNSSNTTRRFGTNKINGIQNNSTLRGYTSDIISADFDGLGEDDSTLYEGAVADHDSGCGWFIKVGSAWQVAGLARAVEVHYAQGHEGDPNYIIYDQSWFRNRDHPGVLHPDYLDAVRLSSYAQWLYDTIPERLPGDLTGDDYVDFRDFAVLSQFWLNYNCHSPDWCLGADCEPDGDVDWADLAALIDGWLCDWGCY